MEDIQGVRNGKKNLQSLWKVCRVQSKLDNRKDSYVLVLRIHDRRDRVFTSPFNSEKVYELWSRKVGMK